MGSDLPVIDLSLLQSTFGEKENLYLEGNDELKKLGEACRELGFFHIVNHGVDRAFIHKIDCVARDMFSLPEEEKNRAIYPISSTGYSSANVGPDGKDSMPERMHFPGDSVLLNSVDQISTKLWPHGNHQFRETTHTYKSNMMSLARRILKLIILSLGLDMSKHYKSDPFGSCMEGYLLMNYYSNTRDEEEPQNAHKTSIGHTNLSFLTILHQDDVGGLQIRTREGNWIDIKPLKRPFVVNLGDIAQMWSNSIYRSAEHCVVYGGLKQKKGRLSIAFFLTFENKVEIKAPQELINEEHPQKYKAARFGDIIAQYIKLGPTLGGAASYFLLKDYHTF